MSKRLRYIGDTPVTFITGNVGLVEPGAEFTVADDLVEAFIHRADIEPVEPGPRKRRTPDTEPDTNPGTEPDPDAIGADTPVLVEEPPPAS